MSLTQRQQRDDHAATRMPCAPTTVRPAHVLREVAAPVALKARRRPRQSRSRFTVTAILDATARVLLKHGYEKCTTKLIAEVAGVGIGSLYEYFPNREALVAATVERELDRFVAVLQRDLMASFDRPFADALRFALTGAIHELASRRDLLSVLLVEYPHLGQLSALGRVPMRAAELAAFCLRRWGTEVSVADHPATYYVLANMLVGVCLSHTLRPAAQVSSEAMLDALMEILLRVLQPGASTTA
ncbi:MAG TPA: TetR/AcrR family transcriptional regulator [Polyangiales bacterium]|nr:TetR/AcrR family transcriptional regulator [Polyangiales bacterium]